MRKNILSDLLRWLEINYRARHQIAVRDDDVLHALRDSKQAKGISLPVEFWEQLPEKLRHPKAILLDDQQKQPTLLFVYETEQGKVAVKMDYEIKLKDVLSGKKLPHKLNMVRTASRLEDLSALGRFEVLYGELWLLRWFAWFEQDNAGLCQATFPVGNPHRKITIRPRGI